MFENMGFDAEDYKYMKNAIEEAGQRINEFLTLEAKLPPEGL